MSSCTPVTWLWDSLILSYRPLRLCSFFLKPCFHCYSDFFYRLHFVIEPLLKIFNFRFLFQFWKFYLVIFFVASVSFPRTSVFSFQMFLPLPNGAQSEKLLKVVLTNTSNIWDILRLAPVDRLFPWDLITNPFMLAC